MRSKSELVIRSYEGNEARNVILYNSSKTPRVDRIVISTLKGDAGLVFLFYCTFCRAPAGLLVEP